MDDATLVTLARSRHENAWDTLYRAYRPMLLRKARAYIRHGYDAEDVIQEAFRRAFLAINSLDEPSAFASWIGRIVRNCAISWQRAKDAAKEGGGIDLVPIHEMEIPMPGTDESSALLTKALDEDIKSILGNWEASIYLSYEAHGFSVAEIAVETGLTLAATHKKLQRARNKLRRCREFRRKYGPDDLES